MQRWKITIEYDGTQFFGWQKQPDAVCVQQILEEAIAEFSREKIDVSGSGRTDTGVHAFGQVAHFDMEREMEPYQVIDAVNHCLGPYEIAIVAAEKVDDEFHARFSATQRGYIYKILNRRSPSPIYKNRVWNFINPLDESLMQEAADLLIGKHDFSSFRASGCQAESPLKTIDEIKMTRDGEFVFMHISAKSFMYHQVRNIIGTLVLVGDGSMTLDEFKEIFESLDRKKAGITAPPGGLYFNEIKY